MLSSQGFLDRVLLIIGIMMCVLHIGQCHIVDIYLQKYLDRCLDGMNHKDRPGPESDLFKQCSPWKKRSCCTEQVAKDLHLEETWYRFNYSHCAPMSPQCEKFQKQDLCFYECSPNVGPWLKPQKKIIRNERFVDVPLCRSECSAWWDACKNDMTCVQNWGNDFTWGKDGNQCPVDATCRTFKEMYGSAEGMCEKIWGGSFKVTPDDQPCMVLWFNGNGTNPNDKVAQMKAAELTMSSPAENTAIVQRTLVVLLTLFTIVINCLLW